VLVSSQLTPHIPQDDHERKALLYSRVSTNPQEEQGTSLETQEAALQAFCKAHSLIPVITLRETWSGLTLDRPELTRLRELVVHRQIDVVVYSTDRLSRDPVHLLLLLEEFDKLGIKTHFVTEPRDGSLEGQLITFVRGWTGKVEAVKIAERTQRGRRARAQLGKLPTGARRYGWTYNSDTGKREINEVEAQVIRDMASWVIKEGLSWGGIRARLHENGIPAPEGGEWWGLSTIRRILTDRALIGESFGYKYRCVKPRNGGTPGRRYLKSHHEERPRDEWVSLPDATPPILPGDDFAALQQQLKRNSSMVSRAQKYQYLLSGFVFCATCGSRLAGEPLHGGPRYYRCVGRRNPSREHRCRAPAVNADGLELLVTSIFDGIWLTPENLRLSILRNYEPGNRAPLEAKVQELEHRLSQLDAEEDRLLRCYVRGDFEEGHLDREKKRQASERQRLTEEKGDLTRALEDLATHALDEEAIEQIRKVTLERWRVMSFGERRHLLSWLKMKFEILPDRSLRYSGMLPVPDLVSAQLAQLQPASGAFSQHSAFSAGHWRYRPQRRPDVHRDRRQRQS